MALVKIYKQGSGGGGGGGVPVILAGSGTGSSYRCGASNTASGDYSMAWGKCATASGYYSTASGLCTNASGYHSTASGRNITASGYYYASVHNGLFNHIGNATCSLFANYGVVLNGNANNTTGGTWSGLYWSVAPTPADSGCYSFIGNGFQNSASARYSSVLNGRCNVACGRYSTASGNQTTASGYYSTASGYQTNASAYFSTASGSYTIASDCHSTASGRCTTASGYSSTASGYGTTASECYTLAQGLWSCASQFGQRSWANGSFSGTATDQQQVQYNLSNTTSSTTPAYLFLQGGSTGEISIKTNSVMMLNINTIGIETDGAPVGSSQVYAIIKNVAGTTSIIHQNVIADHYGVGGLAITISADNTNDTLRIQVTGTANTMRWVSYVNGVEILYAT